MMQNDTDFLAGLTPELLQKLIELGTADQQTALLTEKAQRASGLLGTPGAQGYNVGGTYRAAHPLEHLAAAFQRVMGARQIRDADEERRQLIAKTQEGRRSFVDLLRNALRERQAQAPQGTVVDTVGADPRQRWTGSGILKPTY